MAAPLAAADIVLLDPPYGGEVARATLIALSAANLRAEARVALEHHARDLVPERVGRLARIRERRYGQTVVSLFQPGATESADLEENAS